MKFIVQGNESLTEEESRCDPWRRIPCDGNAVGEKRRYRGIDAIRMRYYGGKGLRDVPKEGKVASIARLTRQRTTACV